MPPLGATKNANLCTLQFWLDAQKVSNLLNVMMIKREESWLLGILDQWWLISIWTGRAKGKETRVDKKNQWFKNNNKMDFYFI